eukprot:59774-Amphidinium_carterae.1
MCFSPAEQEQQQERKNKRSQKKKNTDGRGWGHESGGEGWHWLLPGARFASRHKIEASKAASTAIVTIPFRQAAGPHQLRRVQSRTVGNASVRQVAWLAAAEAKSPATRACACDQTRAPHCLARFIWMPGTPICVVTDESVAAASDCKGVP